MEVVTLPWVCVWECECMCVFVRERKREMGGHTGGAEGQAGGSAALPAVGRSRQDGGRRRPPRAALQVSEQINLWAQRLRVRGLRRTAVRL